MAIIAFEEGAVYLAESFATQILTMAVTTVALACNVQMAGVASPTEVPAPCMARAARAIATNENDALHLHHPAEARANHAFLSLANVVPNLAIFTAL